MDRKEFAEYLGVNYQQYCRWERHTVEPGIETLWEIKKKLNCKLDDLIDEMP